MSHTYRTPRRFFPHRLLCGLFALGLAVGCSVAPNDADMKIKNTASSQGNDCGALAHKSLIGIRYNSLADLPKHRWIRPGYKYSQQYIPSRLNIETNEDGIITAVRCG